MLNSSNDNPSVQDVSDLKSKLGVSTPKAATGSAAPSWAQSANAPDSAANSSESEEEDYNYVVPLKPLDENEVQQLKWSVQSDNSKLPFIIGIILAAFVIGTAIGYVSATISATKGDVTRKASVARIIQNTTKVRVAGFKAFAKEFAKVADSKYDDMLFAQNIRNYAQHNFMLDISSDVSAEVVLLAGDARANPIADLRSYSANTLLLTQLLSVHVNETTADAEEIRMQQESGATNAITYAMQISADAVYYLETEAPRTQYANGVLAIYTVKSALADDTEASEVYSQMKINNTWSEQQRKQRDYVPVKKDAATADLDLPNRMLYEVADRRGREQTIFADELILVDRKLLFGNAANALERYNRRTAQIKKIVDETLQIGQSIEGTLNTFIASN